MTVSTETYIVVALAFAVFSAVTAIGSAIILGIGYERLRNGLEKVKENLGLVVKQTGFFANAIHTLDQKVNSFESQHEKLVQRTQQNQDHTEELLKKTKDLTNEFAHQIITNAGDIKEQSNLGISFDPAGQLHPVNTPASKDISFEKEQVSNDDTSLDLNLPHFYPVDENNQIRYM